MGGRIRFSREEIQYITLFESMTGAKVKDCVEGEGMMSFVIKEGDMGLAIGKKGASIERVRKALGKSVWVIEDSENAGSFIENMFHPVSLRGVRMDKSPEDVTTAVIEVSRANRGKVIGPEGRKIKLARELVKRSFGISDLTVRVV